MMSLIVQKEKQNPQKMTNMRIPYMKNMAGRQMSNHYIVHLKRI